MEQEGGGVRDIKMPNEARLIDANALEKHLHNIAIYMQDAGFASYAAAMGEAAVIVSKSSAVDAVKVVRCKDCANRAIADKCPMCHQEWFDVFYGMDCTTIDDTTDDGFCHCGAKMDKEAAE